MNWDAPQISALIRAALDEDVGAGDLTSYALLPGDSQARARILAKQELVVAGLPLAERVFGAVDKELRFEVVAAEGSRIAADTCVARLAGRARAILIPERTALNFVAHLSGIATLTRRFVEAIAGTRACIRDTRKTTPLLRALEKYAVHVGGGTNHRFGLFDAILIKENHIAAAGSVTEALRRARQFVAAYQPVIPEMTAYEAFRPSGQKGSVSVQIEVRDEKELHEALAADADTLLLDNVSPAEAARLVGVARRERPACLIEVSGGVTLSNVRAYAEAGVDFISVGALTHSAPTADLSLLVEPARGE
jgi:nicotinate-nucleotide pyrophosphorylase (carboxylating)